MQATLPLSSPAANHHGFVRNLFGLLHVGHQLVSILHIAQVVDASQVGVLGAKLVQGRVLQTGWGQGLNKAAAQACMRLAATRLAPEEQYTYIQTGTRQQPGKAACLA